MRFQYNPITEGSSRSSNADIKRFLEFALGCSYELETQLIIVDEMKLVGGYNIIGLMEKFKSEQKMINSLISKLKKEEPKTNNQ